MLIWGVLAHVHIYIKKHNSLILSICKHGVKIRDTTVSIFFIIKIISFWRNLSVPGAS